MGMLDWMTTHQIVMGLLVGAVLGAVVCIFDVLSER